jgi:TDG/mug DNA glycosylase family protein
MPKTQRFKPTAEQLKAAEGKRVPDLIAADLRVLFVGINPSVYSAAVGHHFARPGNRFWPAIYGGGFTSRLLSPWEEEDLLIAGCGITNVVDRATVAAAELSPQEYVAGGRRLERKVMRFAPRVVAFLGVTSYRAAYARPRAVIGPQEERIGESRVWVLPNPSGLNAHFTPRQLGELFGQMRLAIERGGR